MAPLPTPITIKRVNDEETKKGHFFHLLLLLFLLPLTTTITAKRMRDSCVNEIIETEKNFVMDLGICIQCFILPAKKVLGEKEFRVCPFPFLVCFRIYLNLKMTHLYKH